MANSDSNLPIKRAVYDAYGNKWIEDAEPKALAPAPQKVFNFPPNFLSAFEATLSEIASASQKYPAANSAHEGFAVIYEEFDELKQHVWTNQQKRDISAMYKEAIQVAAMAIRFAAEVCNEEIGRK